MLSRRLKCIALQGCTIFRRRQHLVRAKCTGFARPRTCEERNLHVRRPLKHNALGSFHLYQKAPGRYGWALSNGFPRFYGSKGDKNDTTEGKQVPAKDPSDFDKGKVLNAKFRTVTGHCGDHARLGEQDQKEWLEIERLSFEGQNQESPFLTRKERLKKEILRRVVPWENICLSWDTFPYYISEEVKNTLVECGISHLKHRHFTSAYGDRLPSSGGRILLQSVPGTELYRERIVRTLSHELSVPLLVLDCDLHASFGLNKELASESDVEDHDDESGGEFTSLSDAEDDETFNEGDSDGGKSESEGASPEVLKKIAHISVDELAEKLSTELDSEAASASCQSDDANSSQKSGRQFRRGDRVKYVGASVNVGENRIILGKIPTAEGPTNAYTSISGRFLSSGQRGEVYEVNGEQVAVILDQTMNKDEKDTKEKVAEDGKSSIYWIDVQELVFDDDIEAQDWYIALQAFKEVLPTLEPLIVYFRDPGHWLKSVPKSQRKKFMQKLEETVDELPGPILFICGRSKIQAGPKEKGKMVLFPQLGPMNRLPIPLQRLAENLRPNKGSKRDDLQKIFTNIVCIDLPKDDEIARTLQKQLEEDKKLVTSRANLVELHKVLVENDLSCMDLLHVKTDGVTLTRQKAQQVAGWARNHYLSSCTIPSVKCDRLDLSRDSLEAAIIRLRNEETTSKRPLQNFKVIAKDDYESNFISAVVPPGEIGVKFEDIGALEDVKKTLHELVTLPMRRPELFAHGNLLRPCRGVLLFGPPGTGKTLLAKALATEAGANFLSITGSVLTSKWFGDAEKLTKALFSFASKLAPVIIFVDEIDSILGARGGAFEHEASRRMRNEFMAAWDGLRSKDNQRILVLGATNRPFDLDDAVIRRLPRRMHVDLPDVANRTKILKIFLAGENLEPGFTYEKLAKQTEGYSGSDLKNLCIAAAYRPIQELLEEEKKSGIIGNSSTLRPLNLDDFLQAKSKVGASVAYDAISMNELRKWNDQYGEGGSRKRSPFGFGG